MKLIREHPYSLAACLLASASLFIVFVLMSEKFLLPWPPDFRHSGRANRLLTFSFGFNFAAIALAIYAVMRERVKLIPILTLAAAWLVGIMCGLRFAV